jgi:hypothetical protein
MISRTTERFRAAYAALPAAIQQQAREAYRLFRQNPTHPGLRFRQVHPTRPIYSARINLQYRAVGIRDADTMIWFWIGPHDEYERLLARL